MACGLTVVALLFCALYALPVSSSDYKPVYGCYHPPPAPHYGSVKVKDYKAWFYCNKGYKLYGPRHIPCLYGKWKGDIPVCKPMVCPYLSDPKYGKVKVKTSGYRSRALYTCDYGYYLYGPNHRTCSYGIWDGYKPICKPKICPKLYSPKYGRVDVKGYYHGNKAHYYCDYGYELYGDRYIRCDYGRWIGKLPICKPIVCPYLKPPRYGKVKISGVTHGSKAYYSCRYGYSLYGPEYRYCSYGKWKGRRPYCKKNYYYY